MVETSGQTFLYDPAGSYPGKGTGDFLDGVSLAQYITYQTSTGSNVQISTLNTTSSQEAAIIQRAMSIGGVIPGLCAGAVSNALGGICGITGSLLPGKLNNQTKQASCPK